MCQVSVHMPPLLNLTPVAVEDFLAASPPPTVSGDCLDYQRCPAFLD